MNESSEDEFLKILKDCWTGRLYQTHNQIWTAKVIEDFGETVDCEIFNDESESSVKVIHVKDIVSKDELRTYLNNYNFQRVK